jgi:hypothetical protein
MKTNNKNSMMEKMAFFTLKRMKTTHEMKSRGV